MAAEAARETPALPPAHTQQGGRPDTAAERMRGMQLLADKALGLTYAQLAERHGYADGSGARNALLRALDRHEAAGAAELRAIENERYELDQRVLRLIIADANATPRDRIAAIGARTRSSQRHARLNGLDAPVQIAIGAGSLGELDDALELLADIVQGEVIASDNDAAAASPPDAGPGELPGPAGGPADAAAGPDPRASGGSTGDH